LEVVGEDVKQNADNGGQANRLAMAARDDAARNAAVAPTWASGQGRGFGVVASKVGSLAGRSGTAARQIKDLIQDSVKKVEDGPVRVAQSAPTLNRLCPRCTRTITTNFSGA
jgi:hypothetical protein